MKVVISCLSMQNDQTQPLNGCWSEKNMLKDHPHHSERASGISYQNERSSLWHDCTHWSRDLAVGKWTMQNWQSPNL
jgi:hypothetical protein